MDDPANLEARGGSGPAINRRTRPDEGPAPLAPKLGFRNCLMARTVIGATGLASQAARWVRSPSEENADSAIRDNLLIQVSDDVCCTIRKDDSV